MRTLDEVIEDMENCVYLDNDCSQCPALHYLKEYKIKREHIMAQAQTCDDTEKRLQDEIARYQEAIKNCEAIENKLQAECTYNPPLDWAELKTMEGKPVWLEWTGEPSWGFVDYFTEDFIFFDVPHSYLKFEIKLKGQTWQAYRKERS